MQKDLNKKDGTISKMAREIESYKILLKEKETQCSELVERLSSFESTQKSDEELSNKEKELTVLRTVTFINTLLIYQITTNIYNYYYCYYLKKKKFKQTENKVIDLNNQVLQIKSELEESQRHTEKQSQLEKQLRDEIEHVKTQYLDMQRAERTVRIDLEKAKRTVSLLFLFLNANKKVVLMTTTKTISSSTHFAIKSFSSFTRRRALSNRKAK